MPKIGFDQSNILREEVQVEVVKIPVKSASTEGKVYYVSLTATCQCPAWIYRQRCRHIREVLAGLGK